MLWIFKNDFLLKKKKEEFLYHMTKQTLKNLFPITKKLKICIYLCFFWLMTNWKKKLWKEKGKSNRKLLEFKNN